MFLQTKTLSRRCHRAVVGFAAIFLISCNTVPPDIVSHRGTQVWLSYQDEWTQSEVDTEEDRLCQMIPDAFSYPPPTVSKAFSSATVQVVDGPIVMNGQQVNGFQYETWIQVRDLGCPTVSAYSHEMFHWIRELSLGDPDTQHIDPIWNRIDHHLPGEPGCSPR